MTLRTGRTPSTGEYRSWQRSIPALRADLLSAGLGDVEMLVEYQLPLTSKRADVVLAGRHPTTGGPSYLVVELKQWSHAKQFEGSDSLVRIEEYGQRPVTHPALQVRDYCDYMLGFTAVLADDPESLAGVAYLHNATDSGVDLSASRATVWARSSRASAAASSRSSSRPASLRARAVRRMPTASSPAASHLPSSSSPSPPEEVQRRQMFVLLDEQRDAYNYVLHAVERARRSNTKTAVIVSGGPGSGKSVIALSPPR